MVSSMIDSSVSVKHVPRGHTEIRPPCIMLKAPLICWRRSKQSAGLLPDDLLS